MSFTYSKHLLRAVAIVGVFSSPAFADNKSECANAYPGDDFAQCACVCDKVLQDTINRSPECQPCIGAARIARDACVVQCFKKYPDISEEGKKLLHIINADME